MLARYFFAITLAFVMLVGCQNSVQQTSQREAESNDAHPLEAFEERNDDPIAAATDRFQRRLSADGTVPDRALLIAKAQRDFVLAGSANFGAGISPASWTWVGPGNIGGRLRPICIHPTNPDIIYVGSASGGVWKTTDGGANWFVLDDFLPSCRSQTWLCIPTIRTH